MPVNVIFRCEFCDAVPDADTQAALEGQILVQAFGTYIDVLPGRWLIWTGRGPLGPKRYACAKHRGDLTALLREQYGSIAWHPWKRPPYSAAWRPGDIDSL